MQWEKQFNQSKYYELLAIISIITFLISLIFKQSLLFLLVGLLIIFIILSRRYHRIAGKSLVLNHSKKQIRLFPGQETTIDFNFTHHSLLPVVNGTFSFLIHDIIDILRFKATKVKGKDHYEIPLSILSRGETKLIIPIKAYKRGVTQITNIHYQYPHLINFRSISLRFRPFYQTEILVYPSSLPVYGIEETNYETIGEQRVRFSPFEDVLQPVGTRDYQPTDPFKRIHWKASAKRQSLQTKVYEKTRDHSWVLIVNLSARTRLGNIYWDESMENRLSYIAYVCQYLTNKGVSFELYLNTNQGNLQSGEGKEHLKKAMEMLAKVSNNQNLIHTSRLFLRVDQRLEQPQTVVCFGDLYEENQSYLLKWQNQGVKVYHVKETQSGAYMVPVLKAGEQYG
ncbi:Uncharacterized conserved protein, DUF58 family, contains vWF domain [Salinibacillus kushneri]|uniref:Uncharacterized conserved protein, DUF58 family, contains vWF domain n=1 Tax=Salinibacillus kushneri TaxID=237682 RepID=A0A1H9YCN8_9BACI|nr:DUF58 domain-containing protein [Salinibacillus kushneri]SES66630.1 Uncharacterized conserved protein, DUF58 family, contains vWF domain [Salinibacillus kushneri]